MTAEDSTTQAATGWRASMFVALFKLPISVLSTVSAAMGYVAYAHGLSVRMLPVCGGVLLLACAASALNEVQERERDAMMRRTRSRPLPSGRLSVSAALAASALCAAGGLLALLMTSGVLAAALGALAMAWYNGVYTYLKRSSRFAAVPGSLIGALPPAIGWVGAGGGDDGRVLALSFFLFMWQVPHFWLLLLRAAPDYERASFPTLTSLFQPAQLSRITFAWTAATAASALLIPLFAITRPIPGLLIAAAGVSLVVATRSTLRATEPTWSRAFHAINLYALFVMLVVIADAVV